MQREELYLRNIVEAVVKIAAFVGNSERNGFRSDALKQSAVAFQFSIIGEAVGNLPDELKHRYPDVAWSEARRLRNLIAHRYFAIDWTIIWDTAINNIPQFGEQVSTILETEFPNTDEP